MERFKEMRVDLGYLGLAILGEVSPPHPVKEGFPEAIFTVVLDGYTSSGIRVHGVIDEREFANYPAVWNNAIVIKVN